MAQKRATVLDLAGDTLGVLAGADVLLDGVNTVVGPFSVGQVGTVQNLFEGFEVIIGMLQADRNATLEIYFGERVSDFAAFPVTPAFGAAGNLVRVPVGHLSGGNGTVITVVIAGPLVAFRLRNTSAFVLNVCRLHLDAAE